MNDHPGHGQRVCQWGYDHGRCRCPDVAIINVACDDEEHHDPRNAYVPKHAKETR